MMPRIAMAYQSSMTFPLRLCDSLQFLPFLLHGRDVVRIDEEQLVVRRDVFFRFVMIPEQREENLIGLNQP